MQSDRRAVGIIRVSQVKGRTGESFSSPKDQRDTIENFCREHGWQLITVHDELQVSGNALLEDRPGLSQAVTAVLTGAAEIIIGAHSERLWWSHEVRAQVLRLVQNVGGEVWAADVGRLSNGSAAEDFSGEVRTSADRFSRRQNAEKSRAAVKRAVERGVMPWRTPPAGYERGPDGILVPSADADAVRQAFQMRLEGASVQAIRDQLATRGVNRAYSKVTAMLSNRIYLGEIHFGSLKNLQAHTAIVAADVFRQVQGTRVSRGRRSKSERLLARLGVLRCANCGSRMVVGSSHHSTYWIYRCPPTGDCTQRVTISAELVEGVVVDAVKAALADVEGRASAEQGVRDAVDGLERAQATYDAAMRVLDPLEPAAVARLGELRAARDSARGHVDRLGGRGAAVVVTAADWDALSFDGRRALVRAVVARVTVAKGRGVERVRVELVGE